MRYRVTKFARPTGHVKREGDHRFEFEYSYGNYGGQDGSAGIATYYAKTFTEAYNYFMVENRCLRNLCIDSVERDGEELDLENYIGEEEDE